MESIVKTGATVEEAIDAGLKELGVGPSDVMVEVLEEASPGLLGEGATPARVRLILMGGAKPPPSAPSPAREQERQERRGRPEKRSRPPRQRKSRRESAPREDQFDPPAEDEIPDEEADDAARTGKQVLVEILEKMGIEAHVGIRRAEPSRPDEDMHWILNISGKNMNRLIGRRGETLSSLQYITRLIVSRRLQRRANIIVDAAQYKTRRSDRLQELANRMADQALSQQRVVTLEPMPPHERRIIHLSLRGRSDVVTRSIGEGKARKVTIAPAE